MPEKKYGSDERAVLLLLAMENRDVPNAELTNEHRIKLTPAARGKLEKDGLVKVSKEKGRYTFTITPDGVSWCEDELAGIEPPQRSGALVRMGFELLRRFRKRGVRLADVVHPADLESLIRKAYKELSEKPQDWVRLAKLRPKLNGAEKDEVDEVLLAMTKTGLVHLTPDSDRKSLTDADRAAAIRIGKEDKHLVAIEES